MSGSSVLHRYAQVDSAAVSDALDQLGLPPGIAVVPRDRAEEVVRLATAIVARERAIADEVRSGAPLSQVMHDARLAGERP
jgi:hypothetical protein